MVESDSLSFLMFLDNSLVEVIELVPWDPDATEAHVCLSDSSDIHVFVLEVSEKALTEFTAYWRSGSSSLSKVIVVLNHTSTIKSAGVSSVMSLGSLSYVFDRLICNHFVVD